MAVSRVRRRKPRRSYKKYGKKKPRAVMTKSISPVAVKKALLGLVETKYSKYTNSIEPYANVLTSWNLFYHGMQHGTGQHQFIGEKVHWKGITIKYELFNLISGSVATQPVIINMWILSVPKYVTTSNLGYTDVFEDIAGQNLATEYYAPGVKIHTRKKITLRQNRSGEKLMTSGTIKLYRNQEIKYKDFANDYELDGKRNYYFVVWSDTLEPTGSGSLYSGATVKFSWRNYFKDA